MSNNKSLQKEDILLYAFTLVLISITAFYLYQSQKNQIRLIENAYITEAPAELYLNNTDSLELSYYKAQVQQTNRIAGHSSRLLISLTTIRYIGFLIGITMVFLGAIMIIRGIRNMPTEAEGSIAEQAKFKIASSSPGVLFSFFGVLIILATILKSSDLSFNVNPIKNYQWQEIEIQRNINGSSGTGEDDNNNVPHNEKDDDIL